MIKVSHNRRENSDDVQATRLGEIYVSRARSAARDHELTACSSLNSLLMILQADRR